VVVPSPYNQAIVGGDYNNQIGLERFNPDGSPDTTFGPGGAFLFQPSGLPDGASIGLGGVTVEPDGAILVTGDTTTTTGGGGTSTTGFIARFEGTGNAPGSEQPTASLNSSALTPARRRDHYTFRVTYTAQQSIVASTLSNTSVYLTGPRRFSEAATVLNYTVAGNTTVVTYSIDAAASGFPHTKTNFSIVLHKRSIRDSFGQAVPGGALGSFTQALR
jgi:hypothetical protein